jgi:hypothetical protein
MSAKREKGISRDDFKRILRTCGAVRARRPRSQCCVLYFALIFIISLNKEPRIERIG